MVNLSGRLQRLNKAVEPPVGTMDDWEIIRDLITAVDKDSDPPKQLEDVFKQLAEAVPAFAGHSLSRIGDLGVPITDTEESIPLIEKERQRIARGDIVG